MGVLEKFCLKNKVGIVTGGTGLYGKCIVEGLCEAQAEVIIASRNVEKGLEFVRKYKNKKYKIHNYKFDLSSIESISGFIELVFKDFKKIDFLVNNSVLRPMLKITDSIGKWEESMKVNATGFFYLTKLFADKLALRKKGSVVNIASIHGMVGPDFTLYENTVLEDKVPPDYFFHKAGVINITRYLASYYGRYNIRINSISPGGYFNNQPRKFVERYNKRTFLNRMANDNDIKGAVVFLVSDASEYITGENLVVDGGYSAK